MSVINDIEYFSERVMISLSLSYGNVNINYNQMEFDPDILSIFTELHGLEVRFFIQSDYF